MVQGVGLILFLALMAWLAINRLRPPDVIPADAPPLLFSASRAMEHLKVIARAPHPVGSIEHESVRDYIVKELAALGLEWEIQTTTALGSAQADLFRLGTVQNIVGRLRGTDNSAAILLVGHYDSVPTSRGASDDGAAVAAILETARALKASPPLKNDVIFLFTDGEEFGLLGAKAFVDEHPWSRGVGVVFNFEARGSSGPSLMFETSDENGKLIQEFANASAVPIANSFAYEIYKRLPNDTDFTIFKRAGVAGLNFAYINEYPRYHTMADNLQNINQASLQHHGTNALALARHFGNLNINGMRAGNAVYFNPLGSVFVYYPGWLVIPLALLALLVFACVVILGFKKNLLTVAGIGFGFLALLLSAIATAVVVTLALILVRALHPNIKFVPWGETYNSQYYSLGFVFLSCAVVCSLYNWFRKKTGVPNLAVGGLLWWLIPALLVSVFIPGGSYLLIWPLLFALLGLGLLFAWEGQSQVQKIVVLALYAIPGIFLFTQMIYQILIAMTFNVASIVLLMLVLLFGLLIPHLDLIAKPGKWLFPATAIVICLGLVLTGFLTAGFDENHPKVNGVFYGLNADTGKAVWASSDSQPDEWTAQFFPTPTRGTLTELIPTSALTYLQSEAPVAPLSPPELVVLGEDIRGDVRTLHVRITSPRNAAVISLYPDTNVEIIGASVNGKMIDFKDVMMSSIRKGQRGLQYSAFPKGGAELTLKLKPSGPAKIQVTDRSYGLPELPGLSLKPRPNYMMPLPSSFSDVTLVSKTFNF